MMPKAAGIVSAATVVIVVIGCGKGTGAESRASSGDTVPASEGLAFHVSEEGLARGVHLRDGVRSSFEAKLLGRRAAVSTLRVGDKVFEWAYDAVDGRFTMDGHDNALNAQERASVKKMSVELESRYASVKPGDAIPEIPFHLGVLMGQAVWLADIGGETRVGQHTRVFRPDPKERGLSIGPDYEFRWYRLGFVPTCAWPGNWYLAWFSPNIWGNQDFPGGYTWAEWALSNATGSSQWPDYPAGDWTCQGQCGVGCQWYVFSGAYLDCLEHDRCTQHFVDEKCNTEKIYAAAAAVDSRTAFDCH